MALSGPLLLLQRGKGCEPSDLDVHGREVKAGGWGSMQAAGGWGSMQAVNRGARYCVCVQDGASSPYARSPPPCQISLRPHPLARALCPHLRPPEAQGHQVGPPPPHMALTNNANAHTCYFHTPAPPPTCYFPPPAPSQVRSVITTCLQLERIAGRAGGSAVSTSRASSGSCSRTASTCRCSSSARWGTWARCGREGKRIDVGIDGVSMW